MPWTCFSVQKETAACTWTNKNRLSESFILVQMRWWRWSGLAWEVSALVRGWAGICSSCVFTALIPLKAWVPCIASEPRSNQQLLVALWWHAGPVVWDERWFSADIFQGKAWDAGVGNRRCVLGTGSECVVNTVSTRELLWLLCAWSQEVRETVPFCAMESSWKAIQVRNRNYVLEHFRELLISLVWQ